MPDRTEAISQANRKKLYDEFFTIKEITEVSKAMTPDDENVQEININSPLWKAVRKRRLSDVNDLRKRGFSDTQIRVMIGRITKLKDAPTPFDFLKAEYEPAVKTKDYQDKAKKIKAKINKAFQRVTGQKYFKEVAISQARYKPVHKPMPPKATRRR